MALTIGDTPPDFHAQTTEGEIDFHDWMGDSWAVLFSHPKDFTPVCTTELGYMAKIKPEFDKRDVKIIGISVDSTGDHEAWCKDIEETQGAAPNYPIIGDSDFEVAKLYGMLPADVSGDPKARTPADNATVRTVFSPSCCATSRISRLPWLLVSSALRIGGRWSAKCTSTTAPMTWVICPTG